MVILNFLWLKKDHRNA